MSVTFCLAFPSDLGLTLGCRTAHTCPEWECEDNLDYGCCDHTDAARAACPVCSVEVNLSNANAAAVLERLDLDGLDIGSADPADFGARVALANVGRDDTGVAESVLPGGWAGPGMGPTMIDCGRREGYFDDVAERLAVLAAAAVAQGAMIGWG